MCVFLPAAFLPGPDRADVCAVRAGDRRDRAAQRRQRRDAEADAERAVAAPAGAARAAQRLLPRASTRSTTAPRTPTPRLIGRMAKRSGLMAVIALVIIALAGYGFTRVPTGFLPIEDQGYLLASVQLPDGASLERTQKVLDRVSEIARKTPAVAQVVTIAGISVLDNSATLANAGVAYIILKDWSERGAGEDLRSLYPRPQRGARRDRGGAHPRAAAAADPGRRQRRRRHHADRAARRQLRSRQAAERRSTRSSATPRRSRACSACRPRSAPACRNTRSRSTA